ncbi:MAG: fluoride efflux transporter CrcB [Gammaproteobacteria bacterium]|jgi:CrcB protein|nr:fluoride efflux transporter CrcB [Gammaproteobacteria bacterium]
MQYLAIAAGGALGALLRFLSSTGMHRLLGQSFPYGTLFVNVVGSLLMGFLYILLTSRMELPAPWRAFFLVGLLGAFTTFSTFSMDTLQLLEKGLWIRAVLNVGSNVVLCLAAAWAGVLVGRLQ